MVQQTRNDTSNRIMQPSVRCARPGGRPDDQVEAVVLLSVLGRVVAKPLSTRWWPINTHLLQSNAALSWRGDQLSKENFSPTETQTRLAVCRNSPAKPATLPEVTIVTTADGQDAEQVEGGTVSCQKLE